MDESITLELGDTVRLAIGGPVMTVLGVRETTCCCMWFGEGGKLEHGEFELAAIELVERATRLV